MASAPIFAAGAASMRSGSPMLSSPQPASNASASINDAVDITGRGFIIAPSMALFCCTFIDICASGRIRPATGGLAGRSPGAAGSRGCRASAGCRSRCAGSCRRSFLRFGQIVVLSTCGQQAKAADQGKGCQSCFHVSLPFSSLLSQIMSSLVPWWRRLRWTRMPLESVGRYGYYAAHSLCSS